MFSTRNLFLQYLGQTSETPLSIEIEKASGVFMFDSNGKQILDLISGIGVSSVGHCHPQVINAIQFQLEKYMHLMVYGELIQSPQVMLAQKLAFTTSCRLSNVYFVNSGSEATEGALKLAKRYTGRSEIIYFNNAYHGSTHGALSVNGSEYFKQAYRPLLPDTKMLEFGNVEMLSEINTNTACVILETIQGEAGVKIADQSFYTTLQKICTEKKVLIIADEIQSGFGRTGKFWSFDHFLLEPDIILSAKAMGGGMPIGAFISSQEIMSVLKNDPILGHITTFGGNPVCCAASLAVIKVLEEEDLINQISVKENLFKSLLRHPQIKEVRSKGLMMAIDFDSFETLKKIIDKALDLGILTDWFLHSNKSMRIAPPLTITDAQIRDA